MLLEAPAVPVGLFRLALEGLSRIGAGLAFAAYLDLHVFGRGQTPGFSLHDEEKLLFERTVLAQSAFLLNCPLLDSMVKRCFSIHPGLIKIKKLTHYNPR